MDTVTTAIIPAAGLGTRLHPLTRYLPKELLPVGEKPMIQYALEGYLDSDIRDFCIVISPEKERVRRFLTDGPRAAGLPFRHDAGFLSRLRSCRITYLIQERPAGVADAVALARGVVGSRPFACIMPDCLLFADRPFLKQLIATHETYRTNVIATIRIAGPDLARFGNVGLLESLPLDDHAVRITSLSPKRRAPLVASGTGSFQKGFGGGIYLPEYFHLADAVPPDRRGEVDDVPIHEAMIDHGNLLGVLLEGTPFDAGHPLGYRAAAYFLGRRARTGRAMEPDGSFP